MSGIVVDGLESLINNGENKISDVNSSVQQLRNASLDLRRSIRNSELAFLTENLYADVCEIPKVIKRLNAYRTTLKQLIRSYQNQDQDVARTVRQFTPKNYHYKEEM